MCVEHEIDVDRKKRLIRMWLEYAAIRLYYWFYSLFSLIRFVVVC